MVVPVFIMLSVVCVGGDGAVAADEDRQAPGLQDVLAGMREAAGYESLRGMITGVELQGLVYEDDAGDRNEGALASYHFAFVPDGRYRVHLRRRGQERILPIQFSGYDGHRQWFMDFFGGAPCPFSDPSVLLAHWIISGTWLSRVDDLAPRVVSEVSTGEVILLALRPRLEERNPEYWLVVDRRTWLPMALCPANRLGNPEWEFGSYRRERGINYPSEVILHKRNRESLAMEGGHRIIFDRVSQWKPDERDSFTPPAPVVEASFDPQSTNDLECRLSSSGHLFVKASIDDGPPQWFVLDTGTNCLAVDAKHVAKTGITTLVEPGKTSKHLFKASIVQCERLRVGPLQLNKPLMASFSLSFLADKMKDKDWVGIIGYDVFRRSVVVLDAAAPAVRVSDPASYADKDLNWQPIRFAMALPYVRCRMEGDKEAFFLIDTGNPARVDLREEAIEELGLELEIERPRRRVNLKFQGLIAVTPSKSRLAWFEVGGHRLEDVAIDVKPDEEEYAGFYHAGAIGLEILAKFIVVFDYPRERVAFVDRDNAERAYPDRR